MMDRRAFLKLASVGSLAVTTGAMAAPLTSVKFGRNLVHVNKTRMLMGTFVNINLFHESKTLGEEAVEEAFNLIDEKETLLTRFSGASPIGTLNREGCLKGLCCEVEEAMKLSMRFHKVTGGRFDITVKPLVDLTRESFVKRKQPPTEEELARCLECVGMEYMRITDGEIVFLREGMGVTLDGIAKGLIIDWASGLLARKGIRHFLINAGGDIRVGGGRQGGAPWRIAVQDPRNPTGYAAVIRLRNGAIATSGDYEIYYDRDRVFHHIVNPKTGHSPHADSSVSTVAATAVEADALSTGVFVMRPEEGRAFLEQRRGVEGMIIEASTGRKRATSGWKRLQSA